MSDIQQLIQASRLYYELGETQSRVAELLGVTRPQVSRLLKRARAEGIVEIRIVDQTAAESPAADELRRRFGLAAVYLAPSLVGPEEISRRMVGRLAAEVLRGAIRDGAVVGIGDGASISAMADAMAADEPLRETGATVVPLAGGYWFRGPAVEPFRRVAEGIGGVALGLLAPGLVDDPATKTSLVAHAGVRRILDLWDRLEVAAFGIGGPIWTAAALGLLAPGLVDDPATKTSLVAHAGVRRILDLWDRLEVAAFGIGGPVWTAAALGADVARELDGSGAIGEVLVSPYDLDGRLVCDSLRDRTIAYDARELGRIPVRIGVAGGAAKVRPILGALRGSLFTTLVTDQRTAEAVVALDDEAARR